MGAPKQKWTADEEAALKAGIQKYGVGKWSAILKDPEFSTVLRSRSNVDLKDKWRNLNCMANGLGSRHRAARVSIKSIQHIPKQDEDTTACSMVIDKDMENLAVTSVAASNEISQDATPKKKISRVDDVILEAITKLKEPRGSSRLAIIQYIEDNYSVPTDLERTLPANLKILTENGRLMKVKNQYRIAPKQLIPFATKEEPMLFLENGDKKDVVEAEISSVVLLSKAKIDAELEMMKSMSAEDAAAAAARAVAEAEAAIAEAEAAAREAEEAEAEAEAAQCFADAAQKALNYQAIRV